MSQILLMLDQKENCRLLAESLAKRYRVTIADCDDALNDSFDLCILDGPALTRLWKKIQIRKQQAASQFLPCLLVTSRTDVGMATRFLWKVVDELIISPIEKIELQSRVESLLLMRKTSLEFPRIMLQSAPIGIFLLDRENKVQSWNPACERIFGWRAEEVVGNLIDCILPEKNEKFPLSNLDYLDGQALADLEMPCQKKDGKAIYISFSAAPLRDSAGIITYIVNLASDVTEKKKAEASRDLLNQAVEQAGEVIVITDPQGVIKYVNPAFEIVTGYTRSEVLGQTLRMLKSGKQSDEFYQDLWRAITSGKIWKGRIVNRRKDGSCYTEEMTISPVKSSSGQTVNFIAVKRDITENLRSLEERISLQEQLQQSQKLESVGRLAGGVAHDFNNMLSIILGYGEVILKELRPGDPLREEIEQIVDAGRRSASLTRQLLAFSRKQALQPEVLDLNQVIKNLERMLSRLIREDIGLKLVLAEDIGNVLADPGQIEQVVMNLVVNARDAMPDGGKLLIETAAVLFDEKHAASHADITPGKYLMLTVTDTGCGMSKDILEKIFEPFFTTKESGKGTGLGLSMVHGIVKQSGGVIQVHSEPGVGTTFRVYLPQVAVKPQSKVDDIEEDADMGGGEQILVVEDEDALRRLVEKILERQGFSVNTAANGGEALLLVEQKGLQPELMITDIVMPNMNGKDLAERLKKNCPNLKILYMSGYAENAVTNSGIIEPGINFIQKPFSVRDITEKVQSIMRTKLRKSDE
ncbi:MAG: hypothetical protein ACD_39C01911G0003 [uncultured bacterium]|nr:MAG: hypothetical protein ACD_39C01911G0003 [uncultured bacterium]